MLRLDDYNKGLIYTEIMGCIDCNKCIHECPILKSNVSVTTGDGSYKMAVDERECILCGTCLDTCIHDVRNYKDDFYDFLVELEQGKAYSVLVAPSFYLNYPDEYKHILGYLKGLGVKDFYSVSFGADITTWGYLNYISDGTTIGNISQPCPSVVRHIEKHLPELIPNLIPIQSPMMCMAIYLKQYQKVEEDLVFLSPCVAKKAEIESKRGKGLIRHNITFKNLMEHIKNIGIDLRDYHEVEVKNGQNMMGAIYPKPGGLRENIEFYLGPEASVIQVEGERKAYKFLKSLATHSDKGSLPVLADVLNCEMGCSYGTGTENRHSDDYSVVYEAISKRQKKLKSMEVPGDRLAYINEVFSSLTIDDFICEYETDPNPNARIVTGEEIESIFTEKLMKLTDNDQHVDCSACGYQTCRDMAEAIAHGINHHGNCVYYVKNINQEHNQMMEQRLKAMLDASPILCAIYNEEYKVIEANRAAAALFGLSDKQVYIDRIYDLCPEYQPDGIPTKEKIPMLLKRAFETGRSTFDFMHQTLDGEPLPCEVHLERVNLGDRNVIITYARDLREQNEMLAKIESALDREQEANKAKSRFLSNMSHEIRTPMNVVMGITELQLQKDDHPPETSEAFMRIYSSSNMLLTIINDILDLSKVEAGKMEIISQPYETASMIVDTVQLNLIYIGSKNIEFKLKADERLPSYLIGDELRIKQILNNLLTNAFKYTAEGTVSLSFEVESQAGDEVTILVRVSDTGQGMTEDQIGSLFNTEFVRFNLDSNRQIEGSGLGLNIAHRLVHMMGGDIWVESEPGKGSVFSVRLPQKKQDDQVLGPHTAKGLQNLENTQISLRKITKVDREPMPHGRVLVVDDIESNLYVARGFLMPYKIAVETAGNAAAAIAKIKAGEIYDIIFMDHMMPEMDGVVATKIIRAMGYEGPIVALTANAFSDSVKMFMDNGFSAFISKPIDANQLDKILMRFVKGERPAKKIGLSDPSLRERLINSFIRDAKKSIEVLKLPVSDSLKSYIIHIHGMKSALHNVGKPDLAGIAEALEKSAMEGDTRTVKAKTPAFLAQLREVVEELDPNYLVTRLLTIKNACESFEIDVARSVLLELGQKVYSDETRSVLDKISALLSNGDYEEAASLANNLAKGGK